MWQVLQPIHATLNNQLNQCEVIKGRELFTLFGTDIGIDQVTHRRFVDFQVDVIATRHSDLSAYICIIIYLLLDTLYFLCRVTCFRQLICKVRIGTDQ